MRISAAEAVADGYYCSIQLMKLQSEDEGFEDCQEQILHFERERVEYYHVKLPAGNNLIPRRISNQVNSILTAIPLFQSPQCLDLPFEESCSIKLKEAEAVPAADQPIMLDDYIKLRKHCLYNKFGCRLELAGEATSLFRNLDSHLDYSHDNYKRFADQEEQPAPVGEELQFCSNFECGNLLLAYCRPETQEYDLVLQNDINSHGYTQWFYFQVRNADKVRARFNICNIIKPSHHFRKGMKISAYSLEQKRQCNRNWFKAGEGIVCHRNNLLRKTRNQDVEAYYSLEFTYSFEYPRDTVYFALNVPFGYLRLLKLLKQVQHQDHHPDIVIKKRSLSYTVANNDIQLVEVVNRRKAASKAIVITARQHPCETVSSFVAEGILQFLMRAQPLQLQLLERYHFFLLPMVNPDGVVHGCSRLNLKGVDINRQWVNVDKNLCNEAYTVSTWLQKLTREMEVDYLIDLHGHSKKLNTFGYFSNSKPTTKAFANCLSEISRHFYFDSCTFGISEDKENTLRSLADSLGVRNSITIESSYYGRLQSGAVHAYTSHDLHEIGQTLLKAVHLFMREESVEEQLQLYQKAEKARQQLRIQQPQQQPYNAESDRSDSDPEGDYLNQAERKEIQATALKCLQEQEEKPRRKLMTADAESGNPRHTKTRSCHNGIVKRQSRSENERYSSIRHRTEAYDDYTVIVKGYHIDSNIMVEGKAPKKQDASMLVTTSSFRGNANSLRLNSSLPANRKYSTGRMSAALTNYPTSMAPYLSRFSKGNMESTVKQRFKKQTANPAETEQRVHQPNKQSLLDFRNKLMTLRFHKRRDQVKKRSPDTYSKLKEIISISSYNRL